jgi:hypothetical protein
MEPRNQFTNLYLVCFVAGGGGGVNIGGRPRIEEKMVYKVVDVLEQ